MRTRKRKFSEQEKDRYVVAVAEDMTKWERPIAVKPTSIRLSPIIIEKAKYFAKLHKARGYQSWLKHIVEERIRMEEEIVSNYKRALKADTGR
jgi:hypothetical protein